MHGYTFLSLVAVAAATSVVEELLGPPRGSARASLRLLACSIDAQAEDVQSPGAHAVADAVAEQDIPSSASMILVGQRSGAQPRGRRRLTESNMVFRNGSNAVQLHHCPTEELLERSLLRWQASAPSPSRSDSVRPAILFEPLTACSWHATCPVLSAAMRVRSLLKMPFALLSSHLQLRRAHMRCRRCRTWLWRACRSRARSV